MEPLTSEQEYQQMRAMLNEKQWRHYLAAEAQRRGSASTVAREAGVSLHTVKRGLREREAGETCHPGARIRQPGAGRKKLAESDPTLLADLEQALEPKGDPMSLVRWTTKSLAHLVQVLSAKGHRIKKSALAELRALPGGDEAIIEVPIILTSSCCRSRKPVTRLSAYPRSGLH